MTPIPAHAASEIPVLIRVHPQDDVAVAMADVPAGLVPFEGAMLPVLEPVARGHKVAVKAIAADAAVMRYGFPIGRATRAIARGAGVHVHNVKTRLAGEEAYRFSGAPVAAPAITPSPRTFEGYVRADGRVGTRNEIWVLPTVGCVARTAQKIAALGDAADHPGIDGVHAFVHPYGCSQLGDDLAATRTILAGLACHPNAGGVLLVGLGCESNQLDQLMAMIPPDLQDRVRVVRAQSASDEIADGAALVADLAAVAGRATRTTVGIDRLVVGLKCGGSDAFSGVTANPLVGRIADAVTEAGGTAILTEIPEVFGAETLLMERARNAAVFDGIVAMVNGFKRYFLDHGEPVSENPSPGNIAGGITTLEEKSLGAVQKGGHAVVEDVLHYGDRVRTTGLSLLEAPGNDAVSCTALTATGATVILFTTGRGTPLGFPAPTIKIASNGTLAAAKPRWIDHDAGQVLADGLDTATDALLDRIMAVASGRPTAAERNDEREIAIWKRGVTL
ncbi:UxaA family hydrolase [Sphingomonas montana]|uniref:UxaA family hydrolase n=1 Tax=Sphingomonas montana TaxID=1843236 RepID=UPI00096E0384|nr:altronate dehydratase family protein [Sphingomonas montana]